MQSPFASVGPAFEEEAGPGVLLDAIRQVSVWLLGLNAAWIARSRQFSGRNSVEDGRLLQAVAAAGPGATAAGGGLLRSATVANPMDVAELLSQTDLQAAIGSVPACGLRGAGSAGVGGSGDQAAWVQPSGRRQSGEGCEDVEQAVVLATATPTGGALLRITLLAAGFCIGPSGASIREICKASQTDIKSWTAPPDDLCNRSCRVFRIEGPAHGVAKAAGIICDAVDRYKELCEGKYAGQSVPRIQHVAGVEFHYQPPPRSVVPFAASLKGQSSGGRGAKAAGRRPPMAPGRQKPGSAPGRVGASAPATAASAPVTLHGLSRSASLPGPGRAGRGTGSAAGSGEIAPADKAQRSTGASKPEPAPSAKSSRSLLESAGSSSSAADDGAASSVQRPQHADQGAAAAAPLAPAQKLGKDDVLRSVFGSAEAAAAATDPPPGQQERTASAGSFDVGLLLQQLAIQDAQGQAAAALALAVQQGMHSGSELTEPGVLLPASLSPLAPPAQQQPPMSAFDGQQAAQGLANSSEVLAAMAAAWQSTHTQARQQAADQLAQYLAATGLLGLPTDHASAPGGPPLHNGSSSQVAAVPSEACPPAAWPVGQGPAWQEEQQGYLSAFQTPLFTPFSSGKAELRRALGRGGVDHGAGRAGSRQANRAALPGTPDQPRASAAAMPTPPSASANPGTGLGLLDGSPLGFAFAPAAGHVGFAGAGGYGGPLAAFGGSPFGSFLSLLHAEGGDAAGTFGGAPPHAGSSAAGAVGPALPLFSPASLPAPAVAVSLARAASVPEPQGSCTPLARLDHTQELPRANSYAAPGGLAGCSSVDPSVVSSGCLRPGGASGGASAFSSAFSPMRRSPGSRLPPQPHITGHAGASAAVMGDVDRLLESLF
ncbi:hypothetical protein ABPG77_003087 [Micractinium sp. CCAP 211/92]